MKRLLLFILLSFFAVPAAAQDVPAGFDLSNYGVTISPDKRVIVVLATIEAARTTDEKGDPAPVFRTPLSAAGTKFRDQLTSDLAATPAELRQRIANFLLRYKRTRPNATDAELVAPFISMAYSLSNVPDLADPVVTIDLPGQLLDVLDFAPIVRDFYRRSSISANLDEYYREYQKASDTTLRSTAREMVSELLFYLKTRPQLVIEDKVKTETQRSRSSRTRIQTVETRTRERRFVIVPEMLSPVGTVNFVNVKDEYYAIIPPDSDLSFSEVRRAFLQFVIDPILLRNANEIVSIRDQVKTLLDARRKERSDISPDVFLAVSRSLVAAVDAKQFENERTQAAAAEARRRIDQLKTDDEKRAVAAEFEKLKAEFADETALRLSEEYENGAVLAFHFADQLKGVENSDFDIAASTAEMILAFNAEREAGRLAQAANARRRALALRETRRTAPAANTLTVENPVTTKLRAIDEAIRARRLTEAERDLKALLQGNAEDARIYYNLGRVAGLAAAGLEDQEQLAAKLLEAKVAYENVIRIAKVQRIDTALVSLTYVALGRIYEFYDEKGMAIGLYDQAIKLGPVAGGGHDEAMAAKQRLIKQP
ncbi:MAG: hypothetical protein KF762_10070 [Acidobacteria bacterium]|nr:hypothetical protein [Acidobacteriota bacterium]